MINVYTFKKSLFILTVFMVCLIAITTVRSQQLVAPVTQGYLNKLSATYRHQAAALSNKTKKLLKKLQGVDSLVSLASLEENVVHDSQLALPDFSSYHSVLDTVRTGLDFLTSNKELIPSNAMPSLIGAQNQFADLQKQLQQATSFSKLLTAEQANWQSKLTPKQFREISQCAFYYQQEVAEYKKMLSSPELLQQKLLAVLREIPTFKDFMYQNSFLSKLLPSGGVSAAPLEGLQTRADVIGMMNAQLGRANTTGSLINPLQQLSPGATSELNAIRDKVKMPGGETTDLKMPNGFRPNMEKTKGFLQRLEYGVNIQSQKSNYLLPATTDITITTGYKVTSRFLAGVGVGYKLGWGKPIRQIQFSHEGISLRSYLEGKTKIGLWVTGGFELNYLQHFNKITDLTTNLPVWQKSGLIGLTKKWKVGKKQMNAQLLWDFLTTTQVPRTSSIKYRIGYLF